MQPLESVEKCWKEEFDGLYEEFMEEEENGIDSDITYVMTCHPQIIGRPSRMNVLENLVKHIFTHPNIEFVTLSFPKQLRISKKGTINKT